MENILEVAQVEDSAAQEAVEKYAGRIVEGLLRALDRSKGSNEVGSLLLFSPFALNEHPKRSLSSLVV